MKFLAIILLSFLANCESREDTRYKWLMAIISQSGGSYVSDATPTPPPLPAFPNNAETLTTEITYAGTVYLDDGNNDFYFNLTQSVGFAITVQDHIATNPVLVQVFDWDHPTQLIYQAVPDPNGNIFGSFTIYKDKPYVTLRLTVDGRTIDYELDLTGVMEFERRFRVYANVGPNRNDRDLDGVTDQFDAYPDDATRSSRIKVPGDSFTTVAFEDLYPQQGDADFNDYVVRVQNEEDLNSSGKIKRIRGTYEHIAKGAGYNHTLNLKLPEGVTGTYSLKRYNANGTIDIETSGAITSSIELLPDSNTTLSGWNSKATDTFVNGKKVAIELIFDSPMDRTTLGNAPYDLYLKVISTNKEIHFAGLYKDSNGDEIYLDSNGFPWAIAIPGTWKHPYERTDIRTSYSLFRPWYESRGNLHGNWYQTPNTQFVFPTPN